MPMNDFDECVVGLMAMLDDILSSAKCRNNGAVRELVEAEDRKAPLNDDQIAALLKEEGISISRRTVAKYRQQLSIPTARQRLEF